MLETTPKFNHFNIVKLKKKDQNYSICQVCIILKIFFLELPIILLKIRFEIHTKTYLEKNIGLLCKKSLILR